MINYTDPIIVIAGPTASGKSSLAIQLAKDINGYIINADSKQLYKELKIGTAQPIPDSIRGNTWYIDGVKHFLYGHISVKDSYNIYNYQQDVQKILDDNPHQTPILVGGTGLYIDCIVYNYDLQKKEDFVCKYSRDELNKMSIEQLQSLIPKDTLLQLNKSDIKNPIRLIRTIEKGAQSYNKGKPLNFTYYVLNIDQKELEIRIRDRVEKMFDLGLEEENKELLKMGLTYDIQALRSIGYQEFKEYFDGKKTIQDIKNDILTHTLQYAKRQKTWFKRNKDCKYINKPLFSSLKAQ